jgi:hypothetical protein
VTNAFDVVVALVWAGTVLLLAKRLAAPAAARVLEIVDRLLVLLEARHNVTKGELTKNSRLDDPMPMDLRMLAAKLAADESTQWAADDAEKAMREVYIDTGSWDKVRQWAHTNITQPHGLVT